MAATQQLTVTANYGSGASNNVTADAAYSSSATGVATVSAAGLITAVAEGTTTVTVTYQGQTATHAVTVSDPISGLSVSPTSSALELDAE